MERLIKNDPRLVLVDCREEEEQEISTIRGSKMLKKEKRKKKKEKRKKKKEKRKKKRKKRKKKQNTQKKITTRNSHPPT